MKKFDDLRSFIFFLLHSERNVFDNYSFILLQELQKKSYKNCPSENVEFSIQNVYEGKN